MFGARERISSTTRAPAMPFPTTTNFLRFGLIMGTLCLDAEIASIALAAMNVPLVRLVGTTEGPICLNFSIPNQHGLSAPAPYYGLLSDKEHRILKEAAA
jgi:hypothetical protein